MTMWKPNTERVLKSELDRYKTLSDQFLSYLDEEIEKANDNPSLKEFKGGEFHALLAVKKKYLSLLNP